LTTKHVGGTVVVSVGRAISWKAIDASLDDTVFAVLVRVNLLEKRLLLEERQKRGLDSRLTTKHGGVAVVVVLGGGGVRDVLFVCWCCVSLLWEELRLQEERLPLGGTTTIRFGF